MSRLNSANKSSGHTYVSFQVDTFATARQLIAGRDASFTAVAGIALGIFDGNGNYTGNVKETGGAQPETAVADVFMKFAHCGANGTINADQVGQIVATVNPGDSYPSTGSGSSGGGNNGGGGGGHFEYYSAEEWIYYTQPNGHYGSYLATVTIAVWVDDPSDGYVYDY